MCTDLTPRIEIVERDVEVGRDQVPKCKAVAGVGPGFHSQYSHGNYNGLVLLPASLIVTARE